MISFLITIDKLGLISEIKWSNPAFIVPSVNQSVLEIFSELDRVFLNEVVNACKNNKNYTCEVPLRLKSYPISVRLFTVIKGEKAMILGIDENLYKPCENEKYFTELVYHFMSALSDSSQDNNLLNTETARLQFEKIQSLNNELINTKRMLEKANISLNDLNKDLNNRLVKDALTGLVSRYQYRSEIEFQISRFHGKLGIFTFIDLDNFKGINDTYGHLTGDRYLIEFAERLKRLPFPNTIKIRISGDEFGLFSYGLDRADISIMQDLWDSIRDTILSVPVIINGIELSFSLSAGMAVYGEDTTEIYDLIEYGDYAMYCAKKAGKNQFRKFEIDVYESLKHK